MDSSIRQISFSPFSPISQNPISSSVARTNILISSSSRLGETSFICSSRSAGYMVSFWPWHHRTLLQHHTGANLDRFRIVVRSIVFNPLPVSVSISDTACVVIEPFRDCTISNKTRRHGYLKCKPVVRLAYVKDVSTICGASCHYRLRCQ